MKDYEDCEEEDINFIKPVSFTCVSCNREHELVSNNWCSNCGFRNYLASMNTTIGNVLSIKPVPKIKDLTGTPMPQIKKPAKVIGTTKPEGLSRYHRQIRAIADAPNPWVDVYAVLKAFEVKDQAIGHAIKKLLDAGNRGVKSETQDWEEAVMSIQAAIKLKR